MVRKVFLSAMCLAMSAVAFGDPSTGFVVETKAGKVVVFGPAHGARSAQLGKGDVIVSFGGVRVRDAKAVDRIVAKKKPGDKIPTVVERSGVTERIDVVIRDSEKLAADAKKDNESLRAIVEGRGVPGVDSNAPAATQRRQRLGVEIERLKRLDEERRGGGN